MRHCPNAWSGPGAREKKNAKAQRREGAKGATRCRCGNRAEESSFAGRAGRTSRPLNASAHRSWVATLTRPSEGLVPPLSVEDLGATCLIVRERRSMLVVPLHDGCRSTSETLSECLVWPRRTREEERKGAKARRRKGRDALPMWESSGGIQLRWTGGSDLTTVERLRSSIVGRDPHEAFGRPRASALRGGPGRYLPDRARTTIDAGRAVA
jgi:hypothetical protein